MKLVKTRGFTLIEMLVAVAIAAIVLAVSVPIYTSYVRQGRRSDALSALLAMSLAEERYRSNNTTYGTLAQVWNNVTASPQGYYTLSISGVTATGYTLTATAVGDQANDAASGTACSTLTFTMSSGAITKTPAACWPS